MELQRFWEFPLSHRVWGFEMFKLSDIGPSERIGTGRGTLGSL